MTKTTTVDNLLKQCEYNGYDISYLFAIFENEGNIPAFEALQNHFKKKEIISTLSKLFGVCSEYISDNVYRINNDYAVNGKLATRRANVEVITKQQAINMFKKEHSNVPADVLCDMYEDLLLDDSHIGDYQRLTDNYYWKEVNVGN